MTGQYVRTFAEATHALPDGMHMNADYPFMLPRIRGINDGKITIIGDRGRTATVAHIEQSSSFELMSGRKPKRFRLLPFREQVSL